MKGTPSGINWMITIATFGIILLIGQMFELRDTLNEVLNGNNVTLVEQRRLIELIRIMNEYNLTPEVRNFLVSYLHLNLTMLPTPEEFRELVMALQDQSTNFIGPGHKLGDFLSKYGGNGGNHPGPSGSTA